MLSSLANYLLGGSPSAHDVNGEDREGATLQVETRLNQVEVEGDDWILIDRAGLAINEIITDYNSKRANLSHGLCSYPHVEATTALEESWYVTPPACFTRAGPIHVETSPLEDLLIEHPSMSVYRAAAPLVTPDTPPPTPDTTEESESSPSPPPGAPEPRGPSRPSQRHRRGADQRRQQQQVTTENNTPRNNTIHEHRPAAREEEARIVQLRTAQKVLEKRAAQALKRGRLERGNKTREVASGKGKRPRRQDRLRLQNSGANNNRKC